MTMRSVVGVLVAVVAAGCTPAGTGAPPRAGEPVDPRAMAGRIVEVRAAAAAGDAEGVRRGVDAMQDDVRRSMKVPNPARPIDPERARAAARAVPGVHSAVWVDRQNLLARVDRNAQRTMPTIDAICAALEPLGDTLAVVVHVQSREARTPDELRTVSRNCQLADGDRAFGQPRRELDVVSRALRDEHAAQQVLGADVSASRRRADEAARVIEASTPEM